MNVTLPAALEDFIRRKVQSGEFSSSEDVLCEGLRLLQQRETWIAATKEKIDGDWEQARKGQLRSSADVAKNLEPRKNAFKPRRG